MKNKNRSTKRFHSSPIISCFSLTEAHAEGGERPNVTGHQSKTKSQQQPHTRALALPDLPSTLLRKNLPSILSLLPAQRRPVRLHLRRPRTGHQRGWGRWRLECVCPPCICLPVLAIQPQRRSNPYSQMRFGLCILADFRDVKVTCTERFL